MKRLTILAVMLMVIASCAKEPQFTKARLDFTVSGNTMTKVTTEGIRSAVTDAVENLSVRIYYAKAGVARVRSAMRGWGSSLTGFMRGGRI